MKICQNESDIEEALMLCREDLFDKALNDPNVIKRLSEKYAKFGKVIVLSSETQIVGLAAFYDNNESDKEGFLSLIVVRSIFQNRGLGRSLLDRVVYECRASGMERLVLEVDKKNVKAQNFYRKSGFKYQCESKVSFYLRKDL